jgi:hypothetical protein
LLLPWDLRLTPEQFALVCQANPEAVLELSASGQLIAMTPTGGDTGRPSTRLGFQLEHWARSQAGWVVFDSSSGFQLADGSVLSPAAAVLRSERWQALTAEQRRGFPSVVPRPGDRVGQSIPARPPRRRGPAPQDGGLSVQWRQAGLAAVPGTVGGGDLAGRWGGIR